MKRKLSGFVLTAFSVGMAFAQMQPVRPLFPCSPKLEQAYGVCSHITRTGADFHVRDKDLHHANEIGASWVRSDFDFGTVFPKGTDNTCNNAVFNDVLRSCKQSGINLLPIITASTSAGLAWENMAVYRSYVEHVAKNFDHGVSHWEIVNEVNLLKGFSKTELAKHYAATLKESSAIIRKNNPNDKIVFGGLAEMDTAFLADVCKGQGVADAFDIMNFHTYNTPENIALSCERLADVMSKQGWSKPVWLTETGYTTPGNGMTHKGFWSELVPYACKRLGKKMGKSEIAIVCDLEHNIQFSTERDMSCFEGFRNVKFISCDEIKGLDPKKTPFLLASYGEFFPKEYYIPVVDFVRRGGTLICPNGVPFYYDTWTPQGYQMKSAGIHKDLHMGFTYWWTEEGKQLALPEIPTWKGRAPGVELDYTWNFTRNSTARYISDHHLKGGDRFIPLLLAGSAEHSMPVAGIYRLDSDLKGNVIIQTRINAPERTESLQAKRIARAFIIPFAYGVDKVFWYHLRAFEVDENDWESYFGIVHKDFSPKPAYFAYQTLTRMLPDGSTRPELATDGNTYEATWLRPDRKKVRAVWSMKPGVKYTVKSKHSHVCDHLGKPLRGRSLELGAGVVFIVEP